MIETSYKLTGDLDGALDKFEQKIQQQVVRAGVAEMAKVIYDEVKINAEKHKKTGLLLSSIYRVYAYDRSSDTTKVYRVSWNKKTAPHGHLVEFGTSRAPAYPFVRPALSQLPNAVNEGKKAMSDKLDDLT